MSEWQELMSKLTPRQQQICELLKQKPDLTYRAIGQQLKPSISEHTVDFHLRNIYKTGVGNKDTLIAKLNQVQK